jgi:protein-L-isoaspartate(D-aspartate) O-methyltransferase
MEKRKKLKEKLLDFVYSRPTANNMNTLIDKLIENGDLKTSRIIKAFREVRRMDFMLPGMKSLSKGNIPFPIGEGQTISQPLTVAFMLEELSPKPGDKILDIGSGSGWTSSLLAKIVGSRGKVIAIERNLKLKEFGEKNSSRYGFVKKGIIEFIHGNGFKGYPEYFSRLELKKGFDKILCSAAIFPNEDFDKAEKVIPEAWKEQLKVGGRIVVPVNDSIWRLEKKSRGFEEKEYEGFAFVPLVDDDWRV